MATRDNSPKLNPEEIEILKLREKGKTIEAIALQLYMYKGTVQNHLNRVAARFGFEELRGKAREEKFRELVYPLLHPKETIEEPPTEGEKPEKPDPELPEKKKKNYIVPVLIALVVIGISIVTYLYLTGAFSPRVFGEYEGAGIGQGAGLFLIPTFDWNCSDYDPQWSIGFTASNSSVGEFLLQFKGSDFHAVDDLGNKYPILGMCQLNNTLAIKDDVLVKLAPDQNFDFVVIFGGERHPQATYLTITVDSVSGVGPIIFRKNP